MDQQFYDDIYNLVVIDNNDIIGNDIKSVFSYKKAKKGKNEPGKYSKINILKRYPRSFLVTKDNKYLILYLERLIEIYQINKMKLISFYNFEKFDFAFEERSLYLIDKFTFVLLLEHYREDIPDILVIFDIKDINNIKLVGKVPLETYGVGVFTKEKMFLSSSWKDDSYALIYTYQNLLNIIENKISYDTRK